MLLAAAASLKIAGCPLSSSLRLSVPGLVLVFGLLLEQWRYKPLTSRHPGPDWVETDERFVDPETGKLVTVFYKRATGERRYVSR